MSYEAHFWFASGVEVFAGTRVPSPPPLLYRFAIREPTNFATLEDDFSPEDCMPFQRAEFRLAQWSKSGDVAHYELEPYPRRGWRWIAIDGRIHAERTHVRA